MALSIGLLMALLGLSGAVLVLRAPILHWETGPLATRLQTEPAPGASYAAAQDWRRLAQSAYPQLGRIMGEAAPRTGFLVSDNAIVFGEVRGRNGIGVAVVDPYTAAPRTFFIYDDLWLAKAVALHRALLLPRPWGRWAVAGCGMAILVSMVSGAWLWWPRGNRPGRWVRALRVLRGARGLKRWLAWHNLGAVCLYAPLLVLTLTGIWLAEPGWFGSSSSVTAARPVISGLHADLLAGRPGAVLVFLAGLSLPVLYLTGLLVWWTKRRARRHSFYRPLS